MRIERSDAIILEAVVRGVYGCDRGGMGGYIDADHFSSQPFDAALIALAPLWQRCDKETLESFLYGWECELRSDNNEDVDIAAFIHELRDLIDTL